MVDLKKIVGDENYEAGKASVQEWADGVAKENNIPLGEIMAVVGAVASGASGAAIAGPFAALAIVAIQLTVKRLKKLWANRAVCMLKVADALATAAIEKGDYPIVPRAYATSPEYDECKIKSFGYVYEIEAGRMSWRACPFQCPVVRRMTYSSKRGFQHPGVDPNVGTWITPWAFPYVVSNDGTLRDGWIVFGGSRAVAAESVIAGWYTYCLENGLSKKDQTAAIETLLRIRKLTQLAGEDPDAIEDSRQIVIDGMTARGKHIKAAQKSIARLLVRSGVETIGEPAPANDPPAPANDPPTPAPPASAPGGRKIAGESTGRPGRVGRTEEEAEAYRQREAAKRRIVLTAAGSVAAVGAALAVRALRANAKGAPPARSVDSTAKGGQAQA